MVLRLSEGLGPACRSGTMLAACELRRLMSRGANHAAQLQRVARNLDSVLGWRAGAGLPLTLIRLALQ